MPPGSSISDQSPSSTTQQWREHLDVNLLAPAELTRLALPGLRAARGTVVFVNSGAGLRANPEWAPYAASKHGLRALADALRAEEQGDGVRVTSVYPGRTATAMQERVHEQEGKEYDAGDWIRPETVADAIRHVIDLPRDATIPDVTVSPGDLAGPDAVVAGLVGELGESERLEQRRDVHPEPAAVALALAVPTADGVVLAATPAPRRSRRPRASSRPRHRAAPSRPAR